MKEIKLSNKIFSKNFKTKAIGYCCEEVDSFLDEINFEITKLEREIERLNNQVSSLNGQLSAAEKKNKDLHYDNLSLKAQNSVPNTSNANFSNIEILNRLTSLENMVQQLIDEKK